MTTSGSLYFARVDKTETTFGVEHQRKDFVPVNFVLDHKENGFAQVALSIKNPRSGGLLAPGQPRYLWVSEEVSVGVFEPLFFGRLVGWPEDMSGETIELAYDGKRPDFATQQEAVRQTLFTLPEVDPVMIDADKLNDPDTVLIARNACWHSDRVTGEVTISDRSVGEDGLVVFLPSDVPYVSVRPSRGATPLKSVSVNATVRWKRTTPVSIDLGTKVFDTYVGDGLFNDLPKPGGTIGSYSVVSSSVQDVFQCEDAMTASWSQEYHNPAKTHANNDVLSETLRVSKPVLVGPFLSVDVSTKEQVGISDPFSDPPVNVPATVNKQTLYVPQWKIIWTASIGASPDTEFVERIQFVVPFNLQELDTDSEDAVTTDSIEIDGNDVGTVMPDGTTNGSIPIGSPDRDSYFLQEPRGRQTIEHLLLRARAKGLAAARCLTVQADIPWAKARDLSCRKSAQIPDARIPGGTGTGKIVAYQLRMNPQTGEMMGNVTIQCIPGFGVALVEVPGTPEYVDEGVLDPGIQFYTGSTVLAGGLPDIAYSPPVQTPNPAGLTPPYTRDQIVVSEAVLGPSLADQKAAIMAGFEVEKAIAKLQATPQTSAQLSLDIQLKIAEASKRNLTAVMKANASSYSIELKDLAGLLENDFTIEVQPVEAPRGVDVSSTLASGAALFIDTDTFPSPTVTQ